MAPSAPPIPTPMYSTALQHVCSWTSVLFLPYNHTLQCQFVQQQHHNFIDHIFSRFSKAMCSAVRPAVRVQYNYCRSRKSVRGHISMYNLHPVYIPYFLQVLSLPYFTSTTPNKDQQKEQLFYCPFVLDLYPGNAHGLRGSSLAACVFHAPRKTPRGKSGRNWFAWTDYHDSGTNL